MSDTYQGDVAIETLKQAKTAIEDVLAENTKLRRAMVELDCGGGNYMTARRDIANLSGLPMMGKVWDEHIAEIKRKLEHKP